MGEIIYSDVQMFAKRLGVNVVGKKKAKAIEMVLDAIESDYEVKKDELSKEDFNTYKEENQDMLRWYQDNKDFDPEKEEDPDPEKVKAEAEAAEKKLEKEKKVAAAEKEKKAAAEKKTDKKDLKATKDKVSKAKEKAAEVKKDKSTRRPTDASGRRKFMTSLINSGKHTREKIVEKTMEKFPGLAKSTIQTELSDAKNPKYNKFEKLVVVSEKGKLSFK